LLNASCLALFPLTTTAAKPDASSPQHYAAGKKAALHSLKCFLYIKKKFLVCRKTVFFLPQEFFVGVTFFSCCKEKVLIARKKNLVARILGDVDYVRLAPRSARRGHNTVSGPQELNSSF